MNRSEDSSLGGVGNQEPHQDEAEPWDVPTHEEVKKAISKLKNNKAPGSDGISVELVNYGGEHLVDCMHEVVRSVWTHERMPKEWEISLICPLHKKRDTLRCENYRGVALLNTGYKILSNIISNRIQPYLENIIGKYQCGFMREKSTTDQIFAIRQILEKTHEYDIPTFHLFVDFKVAYDSVKREDLYAAMTELGVPEKLVQMARMTMRCVRGAVKIEGTCRESLKLAKASSRVMACRAHCST